VHRPDVRAGAEPAFDRVAGEVLVDDLPVEVELVPGCFPVQVDGVVAGLRALLDLRDREREVNGVVVVASRPGRDGVGDLCDIAPLGAV
jgi:hypothetical protein